MSGRADLAIEAALADALAASGDAEQRVEVLIGLLQAQVTEHEDGFRRMVATSCDAPAARRRLRGYAASGASGGSKRRSSRCGAGERTTPATASRR